MTAAAILRIDTAPLAQLIRRLRSVDTDRREALFAIGAAWESGTKDRFRVGVAPDGASWKPSRRAKEAGGKTLVLTARLLRSITHDVVDADTVEVGTNVVYAGVHQFGATIRPKKPGGRLRFRLPTGEWRAAKSVTVPARPFLGASKDDYANFAEILEGFVEAQTGAEP